MGDEGEFWRDVKEAIRKEKAEYEEKISSDYEYLVQRAQTVGDHHRIGEWDFWWTGTVRNYKTGKKKSFEEFVREIRKNEKN